ncbi:MAG: NAD(P)H-hydrate dehydratase [Elusimicrobiales bacterium]
MKLLPKRRPCGNKGDYGKILIIAGSRGMTGAGVLAARAALKSGAGLVTLALPESSQPIAAACLPETLTLPLPQTADGMPARAALETVLDWQSRRKADLLLIGPGLGAGAETAAFVSAVVKQLEIPFVMDADALNCIALRGGAEKFFSAVRAPRIITPHPGEAARLLGTAIPKGPAARRAAAARLRGICGGVAVLKGARTITAGDGDFAVNNTGGPALAKAGTGDVLAGIIAGLWAQAGKRKSFAETAFGCARAAVLIHGICGDMAAREMGDRCVLAGELAQYLPQAMRAVEKGGFL